MTNRYTFLAAVLTVTLPCAAYGHRLSAEPITFRFQGHLWGPAISSTYLDPPVPVGAEFSGTYTFDLETAEAGFPRQVVFPGPPNGLVLELGPHRFAIDSLSIHLENDAFNGEYDSYELQASVYDESGLDGFETSDIETLTITWLLADPTASALSDSDIPTVPMHLDQWSTNLFHISGWTKPNLQFLEAFHPNGQVDSLALVPEPNTVDLAAVAFLFALAGWVPRSHQHRIRRQGAATPHRLNKGRVSHIW